MVDIPLFTCEKAADWLYIITEVNSIHNYLILGSQRALLFDCGYGFQDFRPLLAELTDLPITVVNSHGHADHAFGNYLFDEVYITEADLPLLRALDTPERKLEAVRGRAKKVPGLEQMMDVDAYVNTNLSKVRFRLMQEGSQFDLGGITLEVIAFPGHSPGSVCLYCPQKQALFTGDSIAAHILLMSGDISMFLPYDILEHSIQKIKNWPQPIKNVWPAHGKKPITTAVLDDMLGAMRDLVEHPEGDETFTSVSYGSGKMHVYGSVKFIYSEEHRQRYAEYLRREGSGHS